MRWAYYDIPFAFEAAVLLAAVFTESRSMSTRPAALATEGNFKGEGYTSAGIKDILRV
ncbi:hypothetical protein Rin_00012380 [Candidatus Regiella insecticola 5.15]|uniref:Uncharacterized protein n=1 Tax=Candidatus Regiella insecticola 5.15 TaxID=1005043 RepID=G2GZL5_9ENTR|nr:hypothetical protein [Candidatus Regiella insecticola]EGY28822.1 hypothetical protein Rin_00012380 [Candidatus Regiella insecticola 5.15]